MESRAIAESQEHRKELEMEQGERASEIFGGKAESETVEKLYGESAKFFSDIIREKLNGKTVKTYTLADVGGFKGEFLENILKNLSEYNFDTIGVDLEKNLKENNIVKKKIAADLSKLPISGKSIDIAIARYILVWNNEEKQKEILKEISRIVGNFAIVQHAGADSENSDKWRMKLDDLLDGEEVPKAKRTGHYFSSREEIEKWMEENNIRFERISERKVDNLSNVFIERLALSEEDAKKTREILTGKDYIIQTTWLIYSQAKKKEIS